MGERGFRRALLPGADDGVEFRQLYQEGEVRRRDAGKVSYRRRLTRRHQCGSVWPVGEPAFRLSVKRNMLRALITAAGVG